MKYLKDLHDGDRVADIYLCKHKTSAVTKNGKNYWSVTLQDKTGTIDAKVWEPNGAGIEDFDDMDYIDVVGDVSSFNGALQVSIKRARIVGETEYNPADYLPVSERNIDEMYGEILAMIDKTSNEHLKKLLKAFFVEDEAFIKRFKYSSAAKSVHHGFIGGLVEHSLSVAKICEFFAAHYDVINRDLIVTAALLHDIGKIKEIDPFPANDYSDDGNLLGHIVMGAIMVDEKIKSIPDFPHVLASEVKHCILSHHGEYEYGSPKKPAIIEAVALNFADNVDAKVETFTEILKGTNSMDWLGFNRLFDSNIRITKFD